MHDFLKQIAEDIQKAMPSAVPPEAKTDWMKEVGNWIYSANHVSVEYGLEYDGNAVEQLSPGTRGIVLLLLYLAIDKADRRPLLIDQPEENLDPQSVQEDLVPHFRDARQRRQVIIVTHNANLVVNTDADQVIVATATPASGGGLPRIEYQGGSLENPDIRHSVCAILEGGERAFLERERRYRLQWEEMLDASQS
jgi:energy-coupling factor transporter ATP-binding protein EcfA2